MTPHTTTEHVRLYCGDVNDWREVIEPGTVKLSHVDGPFNMRKADWDCLTGARVGFPERLTTLAQRYPDIPAERIEALGGYIAALTVLDPRGADLAAWYAPVLAEVSAACALSASCYVWNTDAGEALLRPVMQALGWTWRGCVRWSKPIDKVMRTVDFALIRRWLDITESCGFYQREEWAPSASAGAEIGYAAGADDRNIARAFLASEWREAGLRRGEADKAMGTNGMAGHYFGTSQWSLPTWDAYQALAAYADANGTPRARPYLVLPEHWPSDSDALRTSYDHLRAEYDHLREEYEASRPPFTAPLGVSNVWRANAVPGRQRLKRADGETHPCQKPLDFAERILRASSNPGDLVVDWFAGTSRLAVANVQRLDRAERRDVVSIEADARWLDAVAPALSAEASLASIGTEDAPSLFGGAL